MQPKQDLMARVLQHRRLLVIGGGVVLLIFISSLFFQGGPSLQERAMNMQDRIHKLQDFTAANRTNLVTAELVNANANITTLLSGANANIGQLNKNSFEGKAKATDAARKQNAARLAEFNSRMELAKEANTFELRYRQTVADELKAIALEVAQLARSNNKSVATSFETMFNNFSTAHKALTEIEL